MYETAPVARPVSDPPPAFVMFTVCVEGFAPPIGALNATVVADNPMDGPGPTMSVTVICRGLFTAPAPATATVAEYVPSASVPTVAVRLSAAGATVPFNDAASHPVG